MQGEPDADVLASSCLSLVPWLRVLLLLLNTSLADSRQSLARVVGCQVKCKRPDKLNSEKQWKCLSINMAHGVHTHTPNVYAHTCVKICKKYTCMFTMFTYTHAHTCVLQTYLLHMYITQLSIDSSINNPLNSHSGTRKWLTILWLSSDLLTLSDSYFPNLSQFCKVVFLYQIS